MPDFVTKEQLRRIGQVEMLRRQSRVTIAATQSRGTDTDAFLAAGSAIGDALIGQLIQVESGVFIDAAKGDALRRRIIDLVGLAPKPNAVALGSVDFQVPAAMLSDLPIPFETIVATDDDLQFVTTIESTYPKATTAPLNVPIRSMKAGSDQFALARTITNISSQIPGQPQGMTVSNPFATSVGDDAEDDNSYRAGYREFFTNVRRGTISAIEAQARRYPGVTTAKVTEILDGIGRQQKQVLLGVTDKFTDQYVDANVSPPLYQTESQVLAQAVFNSLIDTRAAGIYVHVYVAQTIVQTIQMALSFQATADINEAATRARAAVINYVNLLAPGQSLTIAALINVLRGVPGLAVTGNEIVFPIGTVVPRALQVLRTSLTYCTANSAQPDRPLGPIYSPDALLLGTA